MAGLRLRWDRISLLLVAVAATIVAIVWTVNAAGSQARATPDSETDDQPRTTSAPTATGPSPAPSPSPALSTAGPSGCPSPGGPALHSAPGGGRTVALTFDDGPGRFTPQVLRILAEKRVRATFFMIGSQAAAQPAAVKAVAAQGHLIGNHTWSHRAPRASAGWSPGALSGELSRTNTALVRATGSGTCWFRPPEGIVKGTENIGHGLRVALWSVDTEDWKVERGSTQNQDAALSRRIAVNAVAGAEQEHPVILMHDGGGYRGATVAALPSIIDFYRANGYTFVRLDGR
jgi:peptidoglycan-N-acetylglucosamine deacetylase